MERTTEGGDHSEDMEQLWTYSQWTHSDDMEQLWTNSQWTHSDDMEQLWINSKDYSEEKEQLWTNSPYLAMFHSLVAGMSFCNFGWVFSLAQIFSHMRWVFFVVCVQGFFPWVSWPHTLNKGPLVTCVTALAHPCLLLYCGCVTVLGRAH